MSASPSAPDPRLPQPPFEPRRDPFAPPPGGPYDGRSPEHRAPADTWRPMSGLCLTAFILALVLAVLAFLSLWVVAALPLLLAVLGITRTDSTRLRGRGLAMWAAGISVTAGGIGLVQTQSFHGLVERLAVGVVAALRAERPEEERDRLLDAWLAASTDRADVRERLQARFAAVVRRAGPAQGGPVLPSVMAGTFPIMFPPASAEPVDGERGEVGLATGAFWVDVPFERGTVHMAILIGEPTIAGLKEPLEKLGTASGAVPVVRDVRFFAAKGLLPADPQAPPAPAPAAPPGPAPVPAPAPPADAPAPAGR